MFINILFCVIEVKKLIVFIDVFQNYLVRIDCFKYSCNFKSFFEGVVDVGFINIVGKVSWFKVIKLFSIYYENVVSFF